MALSQLFFLSILTAVLTSQESTATDITMGRNGSILIEAESVQPTGNWNKITFIEKTPLAKTERTGLLFDPPQSHLNGPTDAQTLTYHFQTNEAATYRLAIFMGYDRSKFSEWDSHGSTWGDTRNNDIYVSIIEHKTGAVVQPAVRFFVGSRKDISKRMVWGNRYDQKNGEPGSARNSTRSQNPLKSNTRYELKICGRGDGVIIDRITLRSDTHLQQSSAHNSPDGEHTPVLPTPNISKTDLSQHPSMQRWSEAGVEGGIPTKLRIKRRITADQNLQQAIDKVSKAGGGVLLLEEGSYVVTESITVPSGVVIRGEDRENVRIESRIASKRSQTFGFLKTQYAGLENLTINYVPPSGGLPRHDWYGNLSQTDPLSCVHGIYISEKSRNNWIKNVTILNSGVDPIYVAGHHNTLTGNIVDGSYNKSGGRGYYRIQHGQDNLIKGETVKNLRHFSILTRRSAYNVVTDCFFATDINFHTGDVGYNLFEGNSVHLPAHHGWSLVSTGGPAFDHMPPGDGNLIVNNHCRHEKYNHSTHSIKDLVYTFEGYSPPIATNLSIPEGGRFYVSNKPQITLVKPTPTHNSQLRAGSSIQVLAQVNFGVKSMRLFKNNKLVRKVSAAPYHWNTKRRLDLALRKLRPGKHTFRVEASLKGRGILQESFSINVSDF